MKQYLSNMFSNINNGMILKQWVIIHKRTVFGEQILKVLWKEGFIRGFKVDSDDSTKLIIFLHYVKGKPTINLIKVISSPSRKIYCRINQLWKFDSNHQVLLISTNKGVKSLVECKKLKIGGEIILSVH